MTPEGRPSGSIRDAEADDLQTILELNEAATPNVSHLTLDALHALAAEAAYFRVVEERERVIAFLLGFGPDARYASENFQWFRRRYDAFVYIDRIVVDGDTRGGGIGARLYADIDTFTRERAPLLACEVNVRPRNDGSLRFHERHGFTEVGRQETEGGTKEVALLVKRYA